LRQNAFTFSVVCQEKHGLHLKTDYFYKKNNRLYADAICEGAAELISALWSATWVLITTELKLAQGRIAGWTCLRARTGLLLMYM
jgi:hypothetical protein